MTEKTPIACSLSAGELQERLAAAAEIGAASLIDRQSDGERHVLRFRADPPTRARLEAIVTAEARCCSFLDLSLSEAGGVLVLLIAASQGGEATAEGLAAAFRRQGTLR
jgi:hypothetical protein